MIYLGSDHGGYELKQHIKEFLEKNDYEFKDMGNINLDSQDDYPDYAFSVAEAVGKIDDMKEKWINRPKGILLCRSAGGVIIAANKVKNVKAVYVFDRKSTLHARQHNDANVIAISGDWTSKQESEKIIRTFLDTKFSFEERHLRRLKKIEDYEKKH